MKIKAKIAAAVSAGLLMATLLSGCQLSKIFGTDTTQPGDTATEAPVTAAVPDQVDYDTLDLSKYIKLDYKNIPLTVSQLPLGPTEKEIEKELHDRMATMGLYELDTTAEKTAAGDYLEISFTGIMDGEAFDGGTSEKSTIYLDKENSGYIAGFADGLFDVKPGSDVELNLTFPENYYDDLAGKAVTFKVNVHGICRFNYDAESVSKLSSGKYKSIDEYKVYLGQYLTEISGYSVLNEVSQDLWSELNARCEVLEYPEQQYQYYYAIITNDFITAAAQAGKDYDTYLAENGMTAEKIDEEINSYIKTELILHGVAAAENVVLSEEEYDEFVNNYYAYYAQYMWGATKEQIVTYLRNQAFMQKVVYTVFGYCELTLKNAG